METLNKYKPTGSNEVDRILQAAHERINESNTLRMKIQGEVNKKSNKKQNFIRSVIETIFK